MFSFLLDVSVRVMFKVSISKPKNVIFCVGTNIDFDGCMTNPNACNKEIAASTWSKHLEMSGPTTNYHLHKQMFRTQVHVGKQIQV